MYSSPSFDPNPIASNDAATAQRAWAKNVADPQQPMLDRRASRRSIRPGSTFKLVTLSAALMSGQYTSQSTVPGPAGYTPPGTSATIHNESGAGCATSNGKTTLEHALQVSCNTAFAYLGVQVGADALQKQAEAYGFNHSFQMPMTAATSRFPTDLNIPQTAQSAIGQYDVRATALQMAMVGAAIGDNGVVMNPYLVDTLFAPDLSVLEKNQGVGVRPGDHPRRRAGDDPDDGQRRRRTAPGPTRRSPACRSAGKTGTAQTGNSRPGGRLVRLVRAGRPTPRWRSRWWWRTRRSTPTSCPGTAWRPRWPRP